MPHITSHRLAHLPTLSVVVRTSCRLPHVELAVPKNSRALQGRRRVVYQTKTDSHIILEDPDPARRH
jgi:hypothetical protein